MGWPWQFGSNPSEGNKGVPGAVGAAPVPSSEYPAVRGLTEEQRSRIFGRERSQAGVNEVQAQQADAELDAFLHSLAGHEPSGASPGGRSIDDRPVPQAGSTEPPAQTTNHDRIRADGSLNISPSAIQPRTMSCRQAFDQAFYCQSLGGKFNDIYRHGHVKGCSEQWAAFWFCMRTRTLPEQDKQRQIMDYYEQRDERRKREHGSSESVWGLRETAVERAFWKDPDADDGGHGVLMKE